MMRTLVSTGVIVAMLATTPAFAKEMHCNVNRDYVALVDGKTFKNHGNEFKLKVKDSFKGVPESVTSQDYNRFVNVKFGAEKISSIYIYPRVRPRTSSECLQHIRRASGGRIWDGTFCDTRNHKKAWGPIDLEPLVDNLEWAVGSANTTTKLSYFVVLYAKRDKGSERVLAGVCAENK